MRRSVLRIYKSLARVYRVYSRSCTVKKMSTINVVSVERYPEVFQPCAHGPAEEVGWFGLVNEDGSASEDHRSIHTIPDLERQSLRILSDKWSMVRNLDLDSISSPSHNDAAFTVGEWRPLFHMRSWIQNNRKEFDKFEANIVSSARTLRLLLDAPNFVHNRSKNSYQYVACKRQGTIYLTCSKIENKLDNQPAIAESARLAKFERLLTTDSDDCNPELQTSNLTYFFSVLGRTFDNIKVLYTQKIDCMDPTNASPPANYVKLLLAKPNRCIPSNLPFCPWSEQNSNRAAWAKSFINGCSQAVVGFRDGGIVERCSLVQAKDIPDKTNCSKPRCYRHWNKERNISFLKQFLELVQRTVEENYDSAVYGFEIDHSRDDTVTIRTREWRAGSSNFDENNILRLWGGEDAWNNRGQQAANISSKAER